MALEFLSSVFFGNTLWQFVSFFAVVVLFALLSKILYFVLKNHLSRLAQKTSSKLDDILIGALEKSLFVFVVLAGLYIGIGFLTLDDALRTTVNNLLAACMTLGIAWFLVRLIDGFIREVVSPLTAKSASRLDDQLIPVLSRALKITVVVIAVIVIADTYFGIDVTAPLVGLGIGGIAIAFAAQQTIADVFGGVSIFTSKPFVVGDRIEFDTTVGVVEQVGLRYTRVRTNDQQLLTVPNAKLSGSIITNLENTVKRRIELRLGVTYDTSVKKLEAAKQTISRILSENELVEKDPVPLVVFRDFKDSSLELFVLYFVQTPDWRIAQETRDRINFQVKSEFEKQKIEFAYPTSTVYLKK